MGTLAHISSLFVSGLDLALHSCLHVAIAFDIAFAARITVAPAHGTRFLAIFE